MSRADEMSRSTSVARKVRNASALTLLAALALFSAPSFGASGEGQGLLAESAGAGKPRPCQNKKSPVFVLCKPRAGIWRGATTQQTPSGPVSHPLEFTVARKGARRTGTVVDDVESAVPWYCGDTATRFTTAGNSSLNRATADKVSGGFIAYGTLILINGGERKEVFAGDFLSRTRVKGTYEASWTGTTACVGSPLTLRQVNWTAGFAG
jgi:hypothetical protein